MAKRANNNTGEPHTQMAHGPACKYNPMSDPRAAQAMAKIGATQADIADAFGVSTRTLQRWLAQYPELYEAVQAGNDVFDRRVERALAERAIGYWASWEDEEINPITGQKELVKKQKYFPPDTKACIFWLTNRMPDKWRRVQKNEVEVKRRSPEEILQGIHTKLLDLKAKGYLQGLAVPALPMRKGDGHG
jgi:transcriptional regulator with XRE-family HTH domain